jgi:S-adenosylmethionine-diacylglycerol 3-amino-3-carboxypropyl transferase
MGKAYFSKLNYTLGNEDTSVEVELVKKFNPKSVFSICGSGGRSLPLMSEDTQNLTMADLSLEQLLLAKLREATYKQLSYSDFLIFWGYNNFENLDLSLQRKAIFNQLVLDNETKEYFSKLFDEIQFDTLLYLGKWEKTFQTLAKINRSILGKKFDQILKFNELSYQRNYYQRNFPLMKWKMVLFLLGNRAMFNALLYKGSFIEKNIPESHFEFYQRTFNHLFSNTIAGESFFLHLCFYGKIAFESGIPIEAKEETHARIQSLNSVTFNYVKEDFVTHLAKGETKYDFLSLSDVPSYFNGDLERNFMQIIRPSLNPGAIIVNRYYLRVPECNLEGYEDITSNYKSLIDSEKVGVYNIKIYQNKK